MSIPHVLSANDFLGAWEQGYAHILKYGPINNLFLYVENAGGGDGLKDIKKFDPARLCPGKDSVFDVANTIFPAPSRKWQTDVGSFSKYYQKAYETLLRRGRRAWGCYFLRLIDFSGRTNQLERVVSGLSSWGRGHKAAFVVHFSSADTDKPRPLGAPCLQYVQFGVDEKARLCLTAVYRSHDYYFKTLGNLLGLSRLLEYVAGHSGHEVGSLTCLSLYAFIGAPTKAAAIQLVK